MTFFRLLVHFQMQSVSNPPPVRNTEKMAGVAGYSLVPLSRMNIPLKTISRFWCFFLRFSYLNFITHLLNTDKFWLKISMNAFHRSFTMMMVSASTRIAYSAYTNTGSKLKMVTFRTYIERRNCIFVGRVRCSYINLIVHLLTIEPFHSIKR